MLEVMCVAGILMINNIAIDPNNIVAIDSGEHRMTLLLEAGDETIRHHINYTEGNNPQEEFEVLVEIWSECKK